LSIVFDVLELIGSLQPVYKFFAVFDMCEVILDSTLENIW
jgi:hypothetical protein